MSHRECFGRCRLRAFSSISYSYSRYVEAFTSSRRLIFSIMRLPNILGCKCKRVTSQQQSKRRLFVTRVALYPSQGPSVSFMQLFQWHVQVCDISAIANDWEFAASDYVVDKDTNFLLNLDVPEGDFSDFELQRSDPAFISRFLMPASFSTPAGESGDFPRR